MDPQPQSSPPPTSPPPVTEQPGAQPPAPPTGQAPQPSKKGYGKKPLWFWILVYVVIGAIVYAVIYFMFLSGNSGNSLY